MLAMFVWFVGWLVGYVGCLWVIVVDSFEMKMQHTLNLS